MRIEIKNKRTIGKLEPIFLIAEIGINHILNEKDKMKLGLSNSFEVACKMIDIAKEAGVDAVKFQTFKTEELQFQGISKPDYQEQNEEIRESYYDLIKKYEEDYNEQKKIADYCNKVGILFLSTPYDIESALFLVNELEVPIIKLASIELNNHHFLKQIVQFNLPIILSTGLSNEEDVEETIKLAQKMHFKDRLILLHCTSDYPAKKHEINLNILKNYYNKYPNMLFGYSDHSENNLPSLGAAAIGAVVIERHFTLDKSFSGPDHRASMNPSELKKWVEEIRNMEVILGNYTKEITESEKKNLNMRKFLVLNPVKKGTIISENHLTTMRTGKGILPKNCNLQKIIGKKVCKDIKKRTIFSWDLISD
ncbi:MAG: N-acetylneuraminate synthase family protein [Candidatus Lokiarchaeota archaeon]|nr:N-acetylneuraminate synthase family protein [Candidatus Harpocratesius repetitus]